MRIFERSRFCNFLLAFVLLLGVASSASHAATLIVVNNDGAGEGFNDSTPVAPVGGNIGTTLGAQRLLAFQKAADIWGEQLSSPVIVRVGASFDPLTCSATSAVLGSAGPTYVVRDFSGTPVAGTWYPVALASALHGSDTVVGQNDISAQFNSSIGTTCALPLAWYYGFDGNPPSNQLDFLSVVVHELGHGLGFSTYVDLASGEKLNGYNDAFMLNLEDHGATPSDYPSMTDAQRVAASRDTGNLHWVGAKVRAASGVLTAGKVGDHVRMYAPNPQESGSSVSHWDTALTPNQIMEPNYTVPLHTLSLELSLFQDIGWLLQPSQSSGSGSTLTTTYAGGNSQHGNMFDVEAVSGNVILTGFDLNLTATAGTIVPVSVYFRNGGYAGYETTPTAWTLLGTYSVTSAGSDNASRMAVDNLVLASGQPYGFYLTATDGSYFNYTNGATLYANTDLRLSLGAGIQYPFGSVFSPRTWNGTVYYTAVSPKTGWWWNPSEGGRGFSIERHGDNVYIACFLYDGTGQATWYAAGSAPMNGNTFSSTLTAYRGGQTLTGSYHPITGSVSLGNISITFSDPSHGTLTWAGGTLPIQRFDIVTGGATAAIPVGTPETGWWWNPAEGGRGYYIEIQNGTMFIAGYMYDLQGNPIWYASGPAAMTNTTTYNGLWQQFGNGQTITGAYQPASIVNPNVGSITVQFSSTTTATLTLPDGRQIAISRYRF